MKGIWQSSLKEKKVVNDINGLIILDKPKNHTSNDCLSIIKKLLHPKKLGHTGTLDENATGVLVCLLGSSTRCQEYLMKVGDKIYEAELLLGISTDTEDMCGKVVNYDKNVYEKFDRNKLEEIIKSFIGDYNQIPPMYSAKKVEGKKLINLARKGIVVDRKVCRVKINDIVIKGYEDYIYNEYKLKKVDIKVNCSKGTYIRTLCKDIGEKLGIPSCMGNLRRTSTSGFDIEDSVSLDEIKLSVEKNDYSFIKPCYYMEHSSVITFGKFETLHLGHQKIINQVVSEAKNKGLKSTVIIVGNNDDSKVLSKDQRISKLKYLGVDNIINFELNSINMKMSPDTFVSDILIKQLKAKEIIVGDDCRFGYKGMGDVSLLNELCQKHDVDLKIIEKIKLDNLDKFISSTLVKEEYDKGNIDLVKKLLGK